MKVDMSTVNICYMKISEKAGHTASICYVKIYHAVLIVIGDNKIFERILKPKPLLTLWKLHLWICKIVSARL